MKKYLRWTALLAAGSLFLIACPDDDEEPPPDLVADYSVELAGENEVPSIATPASGQMDVELENNTLRVEGSFEGLVSRLLEIEGSSAHIHVASADSAGPVLWNVDVDADEEQRSGSFSFEQELTDAEVSTFEDNDLYLNIHTNAYPAGELRGQLDEDAPEFEGIDDSWGLAMTPEVQPHAVETDAEGWAWVILRDDDTMVVSGAVANLSSSLMEVAEEDSPITIEEAPFGETGPVVFDLEYEERDENEARFWFDTTLQPEQSDALTDGDYYINVYTEEHEEGEVRAQIDDEEEDFFEELWEDLFGDDPERIDEAPPF